MSFFNKDFIFKGKYYEKEDLDKNLVFSYTIDTEKVYQGKKSESMFKKICFIILRIFGGLTFSLCSLGMLLDEKYFISLIFFVLVIWTINPKAFSKKDK